MKYKAIVTLSQKITDHRGIVGVPVLETRSTDDKDALLRYVEIMHDSG